MEGPPDPESASETPLPLSYSILVSRSPPDLIRWCSISTTFSETKGMLHVKMSMKLGRMKGCWL